MLILLCLLGSSLGAPQSYFFPSYSAYPTTFPTYNTFLGSGSFPRYYGAAAIPRTGFSYSFGPGYNFQWRYQCSTAVFFTNIGFCRNPSQSLNFLPPVTFAQEEEKVEVATQEVTQQRWGWFPILLFIYLHNININKHFHLKVRHPTCSCLSWRAGVGQTGGEFGHRHQQWDFLSNAISWTALLNPLHPANVCLAFRGSWITQGSHGKCPGVTASICSPSLHCKFPLSTFEGLKDRK